jgi:hypothetical protein
VLFAWIVSGVLHTVYHARHTDPFDTADAVSIVGSLVIQPLLAAVLLFLTYPARDRVGTPADR